MTLQIQFQIIPFFTGNLISGGTHEEQYRAAKSGFGLNAGNASNIGRGVVLSV